MQLREILDLEAMLSKGPTLEQITAGEEGGEGGGEAEISEKVAGPTIKPDEEEHEEPEAASDDDEEDMVDRRTKPQAEEEDDENALSLAQMEEQLKPQALEKFATITALYKKFAKLQASRLDALGGAREFPPADEKKYQKLREQLTAEVESVQFHAAKIEYLVEQLYAYNRRLMALGGQMLRLAERHRVPAAPSSKATPEASSTTAGSTARPKATRSSPPSPRPSATASTASATRCATSPSRSEPRSRISPHRQHGPKGRAREARIAKKEMVEANLRLVISIAKNTPTGACSSST